jgi:probable F420-dependent oxidoreductase
MRYSISLPGPDHAVGASEILRIAEVIEDAGLDACAVTDHPFPVLDETRTGHHALDPFAAAGAIAAATSRVMIHINLVVLPYRSPFVVANAAASVDLLSGGRLIMGVGAGYLRAEFAGLGVSFDDRNDILDAGLHAMELAWPGQPVASAARWWNSNGNSIMPLQGRRSRPTIWIGGNSYRAISRAVRFGDGWSPVMNPDARSKHIHTATINNMDALKSRIGSLRDECQRVGRSQLPEICVVQAKGALLRGDQLHDDLARLEELGVAWVCLAPEGNTVRDLCEWIERLAEGVRPSAATSRAAHGPKGVSEV